MQRGRTKSCLVAAALVGALAAARGEDSSPDSFWVTRTPCVSTVVAGTTLVGYPLRTTPGSTRLVLVLEDGRLVSASRELVDQWQELETRSIAEIPPEALVEGLSHQDLSVRDHCQEMLQWRPSVSPSLLMPGLNARSEELHRRSLEILRFHPHPSLTGQVRRLLQSRDERVRVTAYAVYGQLRARDLVHQCGRALGFDPSKWVRYEALVQLADSDSLEAVDVILEFLSGIEDPYLRRTAFGALRRLTGQGFRSDEVLWRNWWESHRDEVHEQRELARDR